MSKFGLVITDSLIVKKLNWMASLLRSKEIAISDHTEMTLVLIRKP